MTYSDAEVQRTQKSNKSIKDILTQEYFARDNFSNLAEDCDWLKYSHIHGFVLWTHKFRPCFYTRWSRAILVFRLFGSLARLHRTLHYCLAHQLYCLLHETEIWNLWICHWLKLLLNFYPYSFDSLRFLLKSTKFNECSCNKN